MKELPGMYAAAVAKNQKLFKASQEDAAKIQAAPDGVSAEIPSSEESLYVFGQEMKAHIKSGRSTPALETDDKVPVYGVLTKPGHRGVAFTPEVGSAFDDFGVDVGKGDGGPNSLTYWIKADEKNAFDEPQSEGDAMMEFFKR